MLGLFRDSGAARAKINSKVLEVGLPFTAKTISFCYSNSSIYIYM